MKRLTFRTVFGGPEVPSEYRHELRRIKERLADTAFQYELDMSLNIGGEMIEITDTTGLHAAHVSVAGRTAKGLIQMNSQEVLSAPDPSEFLKKTIHGAIAGLLDRIEARDKDFDKDRDLDKLAILAR